MASSDVEKRNKKFLEEQYAGVRANTELGASLQWTCNNSSLRKDTAWPLRAQTSRGA